MTLAALSAALAIWKIAGQTWQINLHAKQVRLGLSVSAKWDHPAVHSVCSMNVCLCVCVCTTIPGAFIIGRCGVNCSASCPSSIMDTGYGSRSAAPAAPTPRLGAQCAPLGAGNVTCSTAAAPCCARECQFQQLTTMAINGRGRERERERSRERHCADSGC